MNSPLLFGLKLNRVAIVSLLLLLPSASFVFAQSSMTLSISPPLFGLNIEKGESWSSSIKVINSNPYDITVYPTVVNFESNDENGYGKFIPILEENRNNSDLLANWIKLGRESVVVPREQSANIAFTIEVPEGASPGGHYAAVLIGTKPPSRSSGGADVGVSSYVTSIILVRVGGEIIEKGNIREFSTDKSFYDKPEVSLNLRFENSGNVHIIPRGDITIYNMWGRERGKILINKDSNFGNVLPQSVRKFSFIWRGEEDNFDVGRYKAVVNLSFGGEEGQTISRTISFWIIPVGSTLKFAGILLGFIMFITWSIKAYVRRALGMYEKKVSHGDANVDTQAFKIISEPLQEGIVDLRRLSGLAPKKDAKPVRKISLIIFAKQYKKALIFSVVGLASVILGSVYLIEVRSPDKNYTVSNRDNDLIVDNQASVKIVGSHSSEEDLKVKKVLEKNGIRVSLSEKSFEKINNNKTTIKYLIKYEKEAKLINQILGQDNIMEEVLDQENDIVIITAEDINKD